MRNHEASGVTIEQIINLESWLAKTLATSADIDQALQESLRAIQNTLPVIQCAIYLKNPVSGDFRLTQTTAENQTFLNKLYAESTVVSLINRKEVLAGESAELFVHPEYQSACQLSTLIVPFNNGDEVLGALVTLFEKQTSISEPLKNMLEAAAAIIGNAIVRMQLDERIHAIFNNIGYGVSISDTTGFLIDCNQVWADMIGYTIEEVKALPAHYYTHPEDRETALENLKKIRAGELSNYQIRKRFIRKDGSVFWALVSVSTLRKSSGELIGLIGMIEDLTSQLELEQARLESEQFANTILNSVNEGIFVVDTQLVLRHWNRYMERISGYKAIDVLGHHVGDFFASKSRINILKKLENTLAGKKASFSAKRIRFKEKKSELSYQGWFSTIKNSVGEIEGVVCCLLDVTEEKKLRNQLQQVNKLEAIGRLSAGIAHDFNNMLVPMIGYAEMLQISLADDEQLRQVNEIRLAAERSRDLVQKLMAFARKQVLEISVVDVNALIIEMKGLLEQTLRNDIRLELHLGADSSRIKADRHQIEHMLVNLASNAQDAMQNGGVLTIETGLAELDEQYCHDHQGTCPGTYALIAVSDTGEGMDEQTKNQIFEPFFSTKGKHGTGLGLASVYGTVKQHGGHIWIYSEPEIGTTFKIYLPVTDEQVDSGVTSALVSDLSGNETVMLVEDEETVRKLVYDLLVQRGYKVWAFDDPVKALEFARTSAAAPDLLLTDVVMASLNASELYRQLQEIYPGLNVLFMSGYTDNVIAHHGILDSELNFIQKPFAVKLLLEKVREALEKDVPG